MSKFKSSTEECPPAGVRERLGAPFRAVRFDGSPHVGHLRYHRHQYTQVRAVRWEIMLLYYVCTVQSVSKKKGDLVEIATIPLKSLRNGKSLDVLENSA